MKLGDRVKDKVTGFSGVVLARSEGLYEVDQYRVHPESLRSDDGRPTAAMWLDAGRLEVVSVADDKFVGFKTVNGRTV